MKLTILGCFSATPKTNAHTTSQVLEVKGDLFLIDCGEGTQIQLRKIGIKFNRIKHVFISHLHGDHLYGLIGLISTFRLLGRTSDLNIYGPKGIKEIITIQLKYAKGWTDYNLFFHELSSLESEFIYENVMIQSNIINSAYKCGIKNIIMLGSSCVYPRLSKQPIKEKYLLDGQLEKTNNAYAIAKISGIMMCESYNEQYGTNYKCLMPTNTFGPNDNYHEMNSHFFPALIRKVHRVKMGKKNFLELWGNGLAKREVIYVDDLANACIFFMNKKIKQTTINIGTGKDYSIREYAKLILKLIIPNKRVKIKYDLSKPNGTPRKVLNISLAKKYGWRPVVNLRDAILKTYESYLKTE